MTVYTDEEMKDHVLKAFNVGIRIGEKRAAKAAAEDGFFRGYRAGADDALVIEPDGTGPDHSMSGEALADPVVMHFPRHRAGAR